MAFPSLQLIFTDSSRSFPSSPYEMIGWGQRYHLSFIVSAKTRGPKGLWNERTANLIAKALSPRPIRELERDSGYRIWQLLVSTYHYSSGFQTDFHLKSYECDFKVKGRTQGNITTLISRDEFFAHSKCSWIIFHHNDSMLFFFVNNVHTYFKTAIHYRKHK